MEGRAGMELEEQRRTRIETLNVIRINERLTALP